MQSDALVAAGAPLRVFLWVSAATAFIGLLTHCNIDVRTGFLDRIFSTPPLHRWHHSKRLPEGNRNYGENVVLWDRLFGTYYHPRDRRPPVDIGISGRIHDGFLRQLWQPFSARRARHHGARRQGGTAGLVSGPGSVGCGERPGLRIGQRMSGGALRFGARAPRARASAG